MSFRTILVGVLAAVCGVFATVGITLFNQRPAPPIESREPGTIMVAKVDINLGQEVQENMLKSIEWFSDELPKDAVLDPNEIVGQFSNLGISAGDLLVSSKFSDTPSMLMPAPGKFATTIATKDASTSLGNNLLVGNRVDIIWTTTRTQLSENAPITLRLLENVKILAVGKVNGDLDRAAKSITLEVKPKMDENLFYAQRFGVLTVSLRNPEDNSGVEPIEVTNLQSVMEANKAKKKVVVVPTQLEKSFKDLLAKFNLMEAKLNLPAPQQPKQPEISRRIKEGMRAMTIQTPEESTALAGLLAPGDRVDLMLTVKKTGQELAGFKFGETGKRVPSETLIENIEILAVDTKSELVDGDDQNKKMSRSVTLIILDEMKHDIARAMQMGTLNLALRGTADSGDELPRTVMTIAEFSQTHLSVDEPEIVSDGIDPNVNARKSVQVQILRGDSVGMMEFSRPALNKNDEDQ